MADRRRSHKGSRRVPCILVIDDNFEEADAKRLLFLQSAVPNPRTPDEVTLEDLERAHLALVDLVLDEWRFDRPQIANTRKTVSP